MPLAAVPIGASIVDVPDGELPTVLLSSILTFAGSTSDGQLVASVAAPWRRIMEIIRRDPESIYLIGAQQWEELIAGAYSAEGFDEVILTPRSGDHGRDVIATKRGVGSVRFFDQVKAFAPGRVVTANDVRAMAGVLSGFPNTSKGIITTTSTFAPRLLDDPGLKSLIPYRIELKPKNVLLPWLDSLLAKQQLAPRPATKYIAAGTVRDTGIIVVAAKAAVGTTNLTTTLTPSWNGSPAMK